MIRLIGDDLDQMRNHDLKDGLTFYKFDTETRKVELSGNREFYVEQILAVLLAKVFKFCKEDDDKLLVFAVPNYLGASERKAVLDAAAIAEIGDI